MVDSTKTFECIGGLLSPELKAQFDAARNFPAKALVDKLKHELVPFVEQLQHEPAFQQLALAPLNTLLPGCECVERAAIESYKCTLRMIASVLAALLKRHSRLLKKHLRAASQRLRLLHADCMLPCATLETVQESLAEVLSSLNEEWVSSDDYFGPAAAVVATPEGAATRFDMVYGFGVEMASVGNHIARCMLARAKTPADLLEVVVGDLNAAFVAANVKFELPGAEFIRQADVGYAALRDAVLTTEKAELIESAMTVVQLFAEFSPIPPDLPWLPPAKSLLAGRGRLNRVVAGIRDAETFERVAKSMELLQAWDAARPERLKRLEKAISKGKLVLDTQTQQAYWDRTRIDFCWEKHTMLWDFLLKLAKSRGLYSVTEDDLYSGDRVRGCTAFTSLKERLVRALSLPLGAKIKFVRNGKESGYSLDLHSTEMCVIE